MALRDIERLLSGVSTGSTMARLLGAAGCPGSSPQPTSRWIDAILRWPAIVRSDGGHDRTYTAKLDEP